MSLTDDELLKEVRKRGLSLGGAAPVVATPGWRDQVAGATGTAVPGSTVNGAPNPTIWRTGAVSDAGTALDRPAYDQRTSRTRLVTDPNAATAAEVAVIRAARTRNPNTPGNFDQMTDAGRAEHWDRYFSGPPKPASNFPVASDFAGPSGVGTPQSPAQFWKTYTDVRLGRNMNPNLVSPEEASARMAGVMTPSDLAGASAAAQATGGGFRAQTKYGPVSMDAPLAPEAKSGRFAGGQKTWGAASLTPAIPVSPIPPTRKPLDDMTPDAYPNIDQSLPPVTGAPVSAAGPSGSPRLPLFDLMDQRSDAARQASDLQGKTVETPSQRRDRLFRSTARGYDLSRMASNAINSTSDFLTRRLRGDPNGLSLF